MGLTDLSLNNLPELTDACLPTLCGFPKLARLSLTSPRVTDAGAARLVKTLPGLTYLNLRGETVGDATADALAALPELAELMMEGTRITDAGLARLATLRRLHLLNLDGTAITDAGLDHLTGCKTLKTLWLHRTKVTDAGVRKLCGTLPHCWVAWDGGSFRPRSTNR